MEVKKRNTKLYGGRKHGRRSLGMGGFGGNPTISLAGLPEGWYERIFGNKEKKQKVDG